MTATSTRHDPIDHRVAAYLRRTGVTDTTGVARLHGDASNRAYFRVTRRRSPSLVLAVHPEPFDASTLRQLVVGELFDRLAIPIPATFGHAGDLGVLALEDLGPDTLQDWLAVAERDPAPLYRQAIDLIVRLQQTGAPGREPAPPPFDIAFDHATLTRELTFFRAEFLGAYRRLTLSATQSHALDEEFASIAEDLAEEPRVLCHRDYHSRNLMVRHQRLVVIDFQDARMGPDTYDLVSLLRDSYVDLAPELVTEMTDRFLAAIPRAQRDRFHQRFDLMSVQRHLKALGTFGHQIAVAERPAFVSALPRTFRYLRATLHTHDRFARLLELLTPHLPDLRM
jgi:aminoglycoside/choline kinase family phosphotransferase